MDATNFIMSVCYQLQSVLAPSVLVSSVTIDSRSPDLFTIDSSKFWSLLNLVRSSHYRFQSDLFTNNPRHFLPLSVLSNSGHSLSILSSSYHYSFQSDLVTINSSQSFLVFKGYTYRYDKNHSSTAIGTRTARLRDLYGNFKEDVKEDQCGSYFLELTQLLVVEGRFLAFPCHRILWDGYFAFSVRRLYNGCMTNTNVVQLEWRCVVNIDMWLEQRCMNTTDVERKKEVC